MPQPRDADGPPSLPVVWRIPPWQPALLVLVATGLIAMCMYGSFSLGPLSLMVALAAAALVGAGFAMRLLFVADEDGIWVRRALSTQFVEWHDVQEAEMVGVHANSATVRINRRDRPPLDVPPSLVLPTLPTGIRKVRSMVHERAMVLNDLAAARRGAA